MVSCHIRSAGVFSIGLLGIFVSSATAETWTVGEGGNLTIQDTVAAALADPAVDDTILIPAGTYDETVVVAYGASGQERMTIRRAGKKGTVTIQGTGGAALRLNGAHDVTVQDLTLQSSSAGDGIPALLVDNGSSNVTIKRVVGVAGDDVGTTISGSTTVGVTMTDCEFSGMVFVGFQVEGVGHVLTKCVADACGLNAFLLTDEALLCTLTKCRSDAQGMSTGGLFSGACVVDGKAHRLVKVKIENGAADGFHVLGDGHRFEKCTATGNAAAGFFIDDSQANFDGCTATENQDGLEGGGLGSVVSGGEFDDNLNHGVSVLIGGIEIDGISASGNVADGVRIDAAVFGTKVTDCTFKKNGGEGLRVQGQICWVVENTAKSGNGLVDEGTGNDGRDNKVKGAGTNDF